MTGTDAELRTRVECEQCLETFEATVPNPEQSFEATCPHCGTHYWSLYV